MVLDEQRGAISCREFRRLLGFTEMAAAIEVHVGYRVLFLKGLSKAFFRDLRQRSSIGG